MDQVVWKAGGVVRVRVVDLGTDGKAVGRSANRVVFLAGGVPGGVPGKSALITRKGKYLEGFEEFRRGDSPEKDKL